MGAKHIQPNPDIFANVSKSQEILKISVDRPGKEELRKPSPQNLAHFPSNMQGSSASTRVTTCRQKQRFCSSKSCAENDRYNEINLQFIQKNKADGPFSSKKFVDGTNQQCKELLDALGIFNSNKELFINLLQDPNSLLIKRIEDPADSRAKKQQMRTLFGGTLLENKTRDIKKHGEPVQSQNLKPCDRLSSEESDDSQSLESIVVLKPNLNCSQHSSVRINHCPSLEAHSSCINNVEDENQTLFSFRHVKKKIRQVMRVGRKECECPSTNGISKKTPQLCKTPKDADKKMVIDSTGKSSHSNIQSDSEGISSSFQDSEKRDQLGKVFNSRNGDKTASTSNSTEENVRQTAFTSHLKRKKSKKHDGDKEVLRKMRAKPWGWMICFSEDDISPALKSGGHITGHMKNSNLSSKKIVCENKLKLQHEVKEGCETRKMDKVEVSSAEKRNDNDHLHRPNTDSNASDFIFTDIKVDEDQISEGFVKIIEENATVHHAETNSFQASSELCNSCNTDLCQSTSKTNASVEKGNWELSRLDSPMEVQPPNFAMNTSPSTLSSSRLQKVRDPNGLHDREVQPLPNCSHDQLLVDPSSSPTADSPVELLLNTLEDHSQEVRYPAVSTSVHRCGSISGYVLELLQASKLHWNKLSIECHSSAWLHLPFMDKMKVFNGQLCGDCVLLYDYINEVLEDVFLSYIRCSPWLSSFKANFQASSDKEKALFDEVMKHVDLPLLNQQPLETLDHLVARDLMKSRTWIHSAADTEDVVSIVAESVLRELTIESIGQFHF